MPNWCMNELSVSGEAKELKKFVMDSQGLPAKYPPVYRADGTILFDSPKYTEPYFCFNALLPTPEEVLAIGFDGHEKIPELNRRYALHGQTLYPIDGYHWNIANWGTKWDVYSDAITPEDMGWHEGAEKICFSFDTAWSPPCAWLEAIAEKYPALHFQLHYEEPGCFFAGDLYGENGVCWQDDYDDNRCAELFGYSEEEEQEIDVV